MSLLQFIDLWMERKALLPLSQRPSLAWDRTLPLWLRAWHRNGWHEPRYATWSKRSEKKTQTKTSPAGSCMWWVCTYDKEFHSTAVGWTQEQNGQISHGAVSMSLCLDKLDYRVFRTCGWQHTNSTETHYVFLLLFFLMEFFPSIKWLHGLETVTRASTDKVVRS